MSDRRNSCVLRRQKPPKGSLNGHQEAQKAQTERQISFVYYFLFVLLCLLVALFTEGVAAQEVFAEVSDGVVQGLAGIARFEGEFASRLGTV